MSAIAIYRQRCRNNASDYRVTGQQRFRMCGIRRSTGGIGHEAESRPGPARLHCLRGSICGHTERPLLAGSGRTTSGIGEALRSLCAGESNAQLGQALRLGFRHWEGSGNSADLYRPDELSPWERVCKFAWLTGVSRRPHRTGCAKAQREGRMYNGIAVAHAVFEHAGWFFTGWSFTEFPNEPCNVLSDPKWKPENPIGWDQPMEELR